MAWNSQNGGGRRGGGGPWGQPPRGPGSGGGGGGQTPPDLDDILRKGQEQLRRVFPRKGGSGGGHGMPSHPGGPTGMVYGLAGLAVVAFWLFQCVYVVQPDEVGVVLRFGKAQQTLAQPGLHFALWPIDQVQRAPILKQQQDNIGSDGTSGGSLMLSGDQNLVDVSFSVKWQINDPMKYLFSVSHTHSVVRMVSEASMREYVGRTPADTFRTSGRQQAEAEVRDLIQRTLDDYDAGVMVVAVNLLRAAPPQQVSDAFEEVQRAQQDQDKFKQDATAYANKKLGDARGQAAQIRAAAAGYKDQVVAEATGEAKRFDSVLIAYEKAPAVTRERMYLETMSDVLSGVNKVLVDPKTGGNGVVPYLPLPGLKPATSSAMPAPAPSN